jgi:hypothetical protein
MSASAADPPRSDSAASGAPAEAVANSNPAAQQALDSINDYTAIQTQVRVYLDGF